MHRKPFFGFPSFPRARHFHGPPPLLSGRRRHWRLRFAVAQQAGLGSYSRCKIRRVAGPPNRSCVRSTSASSTMSSAVYRELNRCRPIARRPCHPMIQEGANQSRRLGHSHPRHLFYVGAHHASLPLAQCAAVLRPRPRSTQAYLPPPTGPEIDRFARSRKLPCSSCIG